MNSTRQGQNWEPLYRNSVEGGNRFSVASVCTPADIIGTVGLRLPNTLIEGRVSLPRPPNALGLHDALLGFPAEMLNEHAGLSHVLFARAMVEHAKAQHIFGAQSG